MESEIKQFFKGEVLVDPETLEKYSKDASLFKVSPKIVAYPKDGEDIEKLVQWVSEHKPSQPELSITIRAAGTDMSGGSLGESIVLDVTKYLNQMGEVKREGTSVEPGMFYRDFEKQCLEKGLILPCYTASKNLCAMGGMIGNNCGGEKSLRYGKMENFVRSSIYVFSDGRSYEVKPLSRAELDGKMSQDDYEGKIYKEVYGLLEANRDLIEKAKPKVAKNSAGYFLWNIWDGKMFDLNKLLTGAQGTLGIMTEAQVKLEPVKTHHDLVALFFKSWDELPSVVNAILPHKPESLETFDRETLKLGIKFMPEIAHIAHESLFSFAKKFLPEAFIGLRMLGLPTLIVLVEVAEESEEMVKEKTARILKAVEGKKIWHRTIEKDSEEEKFWVMRRESFNLLRHHVEGKRTVPIVDDFCIPVGQVPIALPKIKKILEDHGIEANIAGHAGEGNFHIIPLMELTKESERNKLIPVAEAIYNLVAEYKGSITGEHNDGILRTPYLAKMYSPEILDLFQKVKNIFDPQNIFNPGKKVGGSLEYLESHISAE